MGIYITADEWQGFAKEQTSFLGLLHPAAGDAFQFIEATISPEEERGTRTDKRGTLSRGVTTRKTKSGKLSIKAYMAPSGSLGVTHDFSICEKQAWGQQVVTGGTSIVNSFIKHPDDVLFGLSVHFYADFAAWHIKGFVPEEITYSSNNKDEAFIEISGVASEIIQTGPSTLAVALLGGESSFQPQSVDLSNFSKDSKVDVGSSTGHLVTAEPTGGLVPVSPNIVGAQGLNSVIGPNILSGTTLPGVLVSGISGSYKIDAVDVQSISHSVTIKTSRTVRDNDYGTISSSGFFSGSVRDVSFESEIVLSKPNFKYMTGAQKLSQFDIELVFGSVAGSRFRIDMNKAEINIPEVTANSEGEANTTLSGYALPTVGEDEATGTWD